MAKLFTTGCFVIVQYICLIEILKKSRPGHLIEQVRLIELWEYIHTYLLIESCIFGLPLRNYSEPMESFLEKSAIYWNSAHWLDDLSCQLYKSSSLWALFQLAWLRKAYTKSTDTGVTTIKKFLSCISFKCHTKQKTFKL